jgi:hypothetical protein
VYYYFHRVFVDVFQAVIREWSEGMRASGRYLEHEPTFNYGHHDDDDDEGEDEIEAEDIESEDENEQDQLKHKKSPSQRPISRHSTTFPERVINQPIVPRADHGPEALLTQTSTPGSLPKISRGARKSEAIKAIRRGVKELLS